MYLCLVLSFAEHPLTEQLGLEDSYGLDLLQDGGQSWEESPYHLTTANADEAVGRRLVGGERLQQTLPVVKAVERSLKYWSRMDKHNSIVICYGG